MILLHEYSVLMVWQTDRQTDGHIYTRQSIQTVVKSTIGVSRTTQTHKVKSSAAPLLLLVNICWVSLSHSGEFSAIQKAYNESKNAAKEVDASGDKVKESADVREKTKDLQNQVQPANTRDLEKLNQSMASRPDLTPVAKQVTTRPHFINMMLWCSKS